MPPLCIVEAQSCSDGFCCREITTNHQQDANTFANSSVSKRSSVEGIFTLVIIIDEASNQFTLCLARVVTC